MVDYSIKDHFNVSHLNWKLLETFVIEGFDEERGDGVNEAVNDDIFESFVQNRSILIKFLIRWVILVKNFVKSWVADVKFFNIWTGEDVNLETMKFLRLWNFSDIVIADQIAEFNEFKEVLIGLFLNGKLVKFVQKGVVWNWLVWAVEVLWSGEYFLDNEEDFSGILVRNAFLFLDNLSQCLDKNVDMLNGKNLKLEEMLDKVEIFEEIL